MAGDLIAPRGFLLDTHVWLWLVMADESGFSKSVFTKLVAAAGRDALVVSEMSVWEVSRKHAQGQLALTPTLDDWLARAGKAPGISYLPVDRETLVLSTRLPGTIHRDPVDRILMAAAALHGLSLATADALLIDYGQHTPGFSVLDVRKQNGK